MLDLEGLYLMKNVLVIRFNSSNLLLPASGPSCAEPERPMKPPAKTPSRFAVFKDPSVLQPHAEEEEEPEQPPPPKPAGFAVFTDEPPKPIGFAIFTDEPPVQLVDQENPGPIRPKANRKPLSALVRTNPLPV